MAPRKGITKGFYRKTKTKAGSPKITFIKPRQRTFKQLTSRPKKK